MKLKIKLIVLYVFCVSNCFAQKSILINGFKYRITKNKIFLKDEKLMATFVQYLDFKNKFQFGYIIESKRNDSLFIEGNLKYLGRKIFTTDIYHFNCSYADSIKRTSFQLKTGNVILKDCKYYKNGKIVNHYKY